MPSFRNLTPTVLFVSLAIAAPANASQLWGVYSGGAPFITLNAVNILTGAVSAGINITATGTASVDDMASDPIRDPSTIWAVRSPLAGNQLVGVNPFTQTITATVPVSVVASLIRSLAIDPTTGFFYGATTTNLYRIDKTSGATTLVGPTSLPVDRALGFDAQGNLYGISGSTNFVAVDKSNGATSVIKDLGLQLDDLAADPATGTMYALGNGTAAYSLYKINVTSGALTTVGTSLPRPAGMAFTNAPEPATWTLAAIAIATILAARRRAHI
jgi:hypothetical protein